MARSQQRQPLRHRAVIPVLRDAAPLFMLGSALFYTNRWFMLISGETSAIAGANRKVSEILGAVRSTGANTFPFIYELLLRIWNWITGGALDWFRAPAIFCFLIGLWFLSRVVRRLSNDESSNALVWLGTLWPFGFVYGRLASPQSFAFLLVAVVTWQYFRTVSSPNRREWMALCILCLLLLYTDDFSWALFGCLAFDFVLRTPPAEPGKNEPLQASSAREKTAGIFATAAVLAIGFAPRWPAFAQEVHAVRMPHSARLLLFDAIYNFYTWFVSPAMAPWFWRFSIPAAAGILTLLVLAFLGVRAQARRFLIFSLALFCLMLLTGSLQTGRLLMIAPWSLVPLAIALGTIEKWQWRIPMAFALALVAAMGWYGILNRQHYADSTFFEPWPELAQNAAAEARSGSGVISNDQTFFLYLNHSLESSNQGSGSSLPGTLPAQVPNASVWDPKQWEAAGMPKPPAMFWVRGSSDPETMAALERTSRWLGDNCGDRITQFLARDPSYAWKQRFIPGFAGEPWLIEVRQYTCSQTAPAEGTGPNH